MGDIDRGSVFASLLGTLELLDPAERARIRGFVINKFRGDHALLTPGIHSIEKRVGKQCLGVAFATASWVERQLFRLARTPDCGRPIAFSLELHRFRPAASRAFRFATIL